MQRVGRRVWNEPDGAEPFQKTFGAWAVASEKADVQKQQRRFFFSVFTEVKMNHNPSETVDALFYCSH